MLERIAADLGAHAVLVVAPGSELPLGEEAAYPAEIRNDLVLLAQVQLATSASHGERGEAGRQAFGVDLGHGAAAGSDSSVVPAGPAGPSRPTSWPWWATRRAGRQMASRRFAALAALPWQP